MPNHLEFALQAALKARASKPPPAKERLASATLGGLTFSAAFDSGNLAHVKRGDKGDDHFVLHARADCEGTPQVTRARTWFHFSVRGAAPGRTLTFEIKMTPQVKLFEHGMKPVFRSLPSHPEWARVPHDAHASCALPGATLDSFAIQFSHTVSTSSVDETLYFAFCYPLTYGDLMARLAWTDALFKQQQQQQQQQQQSVAVAALAPTTPPAPVYARALQALEAATLAASAADLSAGGGGGGGSGGSGGSGGPVSEEDMRLYRRQRLVDASTKAALEACLDLGTLRTQQQTQQAEDTEEGGAQPHQHQNQELVNGTIDERAAVEFSNASALSAAAALPAERPRGIYYRRELLARSLEGRRIDLLTVTGDNGQLASTEGSLPPPLLPNGGERPHKFKNKRVVLVTARVHPGETPASHVMDGLLEFVLRADDPRATAFRERFILKIIPMLNPDGVYHGHYRCDSKGVDLNRTYILHEEEGTLAAFIDCHAHAGRRGCFFYGNAFHEPSRRDEAALFARLVALNSRSFDADRCTWFDTSAHQGSARAAAFAATGGTLPHVYTLECNYDSGVSTNELQPRHGGTALAGGRLSPEPPAARTLSPKYTPASWREIGKALALAVLDMAGINPHSRLGPPGGGALDKLREAVRAAPPKVKGREALVNEGDDDEEEDD